MKLQCAKCLALLCISTQVPVCPFQCFRLHPDSAASTNRAPLKDLKKQTQVYFCVYFFVLTVQNL